MVRLDTSCLPRLPVFVLAINRLLFLQFTYYNITRSDFIVSIIVFRISLIPFSSWSVFQHLFSRVRPTWDFQACTCSVIMSATDGTLRSFFISSFLRRSLKMHPLTSLRAALRCLYFRIFCCRSVHILLAHIKFSTATAL